jgi:PmbA protein
VEVVHVRGESTNVGFEANRLKSSQVEETSGTAVRIVKDGRLGFAASSDESAMEKLISNVLESAEFGEAIPVSFPPARPGPSVVTYDSGVSELPIPRLVEIGQEIVDIILKAEPEARVGVELERGVQRLDLRNQAGSELTFERSPLSIGFEISRVKGDDVLMMYDVTGSTVWMDDCLAFARRAAEKLLLAQRSATIRSGRMPVLFSPRGGLVLSLPIMLGLNGKNVYRQTSPMAGKIGERLFDPKITVVDDPTLDGRFASAPYDDEGVVHQRRVLVEQGVLKSFMYDLKTAAQMGVESTGNGSRSLFNPPAPSPTNLILEAGQTPLADMIAAMDEGLLVESPLGLGQGNVISGAFSNTLGLAFKIEKGEIVGRVKDVSIAGNIYDLLQDVAAVSQETEWVYYSYNLPYMLLTDMNVVAKE